MANLNEFRANELSKLTDKINNIKIQRRLKDSAISRLNQLKIEATKHNSEVNSLNSRINKTKVEISKSNPILIFK